jgi:hypothetical protein
MSDGIAEAVDGIVTDWERGRTTFSETVHRFLGLVTIDDVGELMKTVPVHWREELIVRFRDLSSAEHEPGSGRIFGGIAVWERVGDGEPRQQMIDEREREEAEEDAHFESVVLPAIRAWLMENDALVR